MSGAATRGPRAGGPGPMLITPRPDRVAEHLNPLGLAKNLWRHRGLIAQFTRREIEGRYRSSMLGFAWSFLVPVAMLLIYTFVFGVVFRGRWPGARSETLSEFGLVVFAGLTAFGVFGECVSRASGLIVGVPNYVKRVVFPLEVLPVSVLGSALFHALVSLGVLLGALPLLGGALQPMLLALPLVLLPLACLSLGLSWFLASLGVFVRDLPYVVGLVVQVLFFGTPIFYPLQSVPEPFRGLQRLSPLTWVVENFRAVVFQGLAPDPRELVIWVAITGTIMLLGYAWFMKTKKAFGDVV